MNINEIVNDVHENAKDHGWWDGQERTFGEIIALCHSELSEALEAHRNGEPIYWEDSFGKPEGVGTELIDCVIRIFDYCGKENIDVEKILKRKHEYNKTRPYRHGNKVI